MILIQDIGKVFFSLHGSLPPSLLLFYMCEQVLFTSKSDGVSSPLNDLSSVGIMESRDTAVSDSLRRLSPTGVDIW